MTSWNSFARNLKKSLFGKRSGPLRSLSTGGSLLGRPLSWSGQTHPSHRRRRSGEMATLETLNFDNLVLRSLPIDTEERNYARRVAGACFSIVEPTPVDNPQTVAYSEAAFSLLDLPKEQLDRADFAEYFCGNKLLPGCQTAAHCYCGHQFGLFSGQLGDGATMYVGEVINSKDERWEIQFKGAGKTPYSRQADGRKVLRSSIREFLCSEAMHHLGIPTTRAGSCVTSDTKVVRDIFYSGNPIYEQATTILRIAESFIRFGSFEIFKTRDSQTGKIGPSVGRKDILEQLTHYVIETFYPEVWNANTDDKETMYLEFFKEVVLRTARLVALWQSVGWCHGVLNTDNMSIVGVTIDYGPFGFIDTYDPGFICNGSDDGGRYAYEKQPEICKWNCAKLAEALSPLVSLEKTKDIVSLFDEEFQETFHKLLMKKFGLIKVSEEDRELFLSFFDTMQETGADFTNSFRCLRGLPLPGSSDFEAKKEELKKILLSQCCTVEEHRRASRPQMPPGQFQMMLMLLQSQPELLEQLGRGTAAVYNEIKRHQRLKELKDMTEETKKTQNGKTWDAWLTKYCARLQKEAEGSDDVNVLNKSRISMMDSANPKFILRNYIAQNAIEAAEKGDFSEVRKVLKLLETPYEENVDLSVVEREQQPRSSSSSLDEGAPAQPAQPGASGGHVEHLASDTYCRRPPAAAAELKVT